MKSKEEVIPIVVKIKKLISTKNQKINISSFSRGIYILKVGKNYSKFMNE